MSGVEKIIENLSIERSLASVSAETQVLAILAGEDARAFGKPVRFTVEWPEGAPFGQTDAEMRQWCAERLAEAREREQQLFARVDGRERSQPLATGGLVRDAGTYLVGEEGCRP